jgi:hypothetical protein
MPKSIKSTRQITCFSHDSDNPTASASTDKCGSVCNTPGCIRAANTLIQNMNSDINPCDDFYQYACGGFEERVSR